MVISLSSKASWATIIIYPVISVIFPNGINQKIDICRIFIYNFVCNNKIHGFSNASHVYIGDIHVPQQK